MERWTLFAWRSWSRADTAVALGFFVLGAVIAVYVVDSSIPIQFYQKVMPSIVVEACGRGMREPLQMLPSLENFLDLKTPIFNCADLDAVKGYRDPNIFFRYHFYLAWAVALAWKALGVAQANVWPVQAMLHALFASAIYVLMRQLFGRGWSAVTAAVLALSPIAVAFLPYLRDYAKAPFICWALALILIAVRSRTTAHFVLAALLAGATIGFGIGFRADIVVVLPLALLAAVVGPDGPRVGALARLAAVAAVVAGFALPAFPILSQARGGGLGAMALEGASQPFLSYLAIRPAPYDIGDRYSDELTISGIAADIRSTHPEGYDARELTNPPFASQALVQSSLYFLDRYALNFPADLVTKAMKSAYVLSDVYSVTRGQRKRMDPADIARITGKRADKIYPYFGATPVHVIAILGLIILLATIYVQSVGLFYVVLVTLGVLTGYPSLQFSLRHFFYLEFVFWAGVGGIFVLPLLMRQERRRKLIGFGYTAVVLTAIGAAIYVSLFVWQRHRLTTGISALLARAGEPIVPADTLQADGQMLLAVAVPDRFKTLISSEPDSMSLVEKTLGGDDNRAGAERYRVRVGGPACNAEVVNVTLAYRKGRFAWQPLDRTLSVHLVSKDKPATLIASGFYRPTQFFEGFKVPQSEAPCILGIERIEGPSSLPSLFTAVLPPDWQGKRLAIGFGSLDGVVE
ncbi:MAG: glycosyltransferase family 39 protein [Nitrobacter sp.]